MMGNIATLVTESENLVIKINNRNLICSLICSIHTQFFMQ